MSSDPRSQNRPSFKRNVFPAIISTSDCSEFGKVYLEGVAPCQTVISESSSEVIGSILGRIQVFVITCKNRRLIKPC